MANVKCGYSSKYYPLLRNQYDSDTSEKKDNFRQFVYDKFIDAESVIEKFLNRVDNSPVQTRSENPIQVSSRTGIRINTEATSAEQFYIGESIQYNNMKSGFIKNIIESSVFNANTNKFVNANETIGDTTVLNKKLLEYKINLLKSIAEYIRDTTNINELSLEKLEEYSSNIINNFKIKINLDVNKDDVYYNAFNAYVTLKSFDNLLVQFTPFIRINKEYKSFYSPNRYTYLGPKVQHFKGFSINEFMNQEDSISDLAEILLNYFPEVDDSGNIIENTSIYLKGFNSVMGKFKMWAEMSTNPEIKKELTKGVTRDMRKLLDLFSEALRTSKIDPEHRTYLYSKLNGIRKFIYDPDMDENIKIMFTHLMDKTVLSSYISYTINDQGLLENTNITDRPLKLQGSFINDVVNASSEYWRRNQNKFNDLLHKYKIDVKDNTITIDNIIIKKNPSNNDITISGFIDSQLFDKIVSDITSLTIDPDFSKICGQVYGNFQSSISLYTPVLATVIFNTRNNSNKKLAMSFGQNRNLARVLNIINGSDIVSVVKNSEGNNLPLYQMICLAYNHYLIYDRIKRQINEDLKNNSYYNSQYNYNVVFNNIQHIRRPRIRAEVSIDRVTKQSASLSAQDVIYLAIGYDYFQSLFKPQSYVEGKREEAIIGFQAHTYSDKNKHFVSQFNVGATWNINGKNINLKHCLDRYFKSGKREDIEPILDAWFMSSQKQMNALAKNILNDYNKALNENFEDINAINDYLNTLDSKKLKGVKVKFREAGIDFIEEVHISKDSSTGKFRINETFKNLYDTFNTRALFNKFVEKQFSQFINNAQGAWEMLRKDRNITQSSIFANSKWVANENLIAKDNEGNWNPLLFSYFVMDSFLCNDYNSMMVGNIFIHPNKEKEDKKELRKEILDKHNWKESDLDDNKEKIIQKEVEEEWLTHSMASRWVSQVKRMVIYGATYHSYAQGLKYGVPETVKLAVMPDITANTYNTIGNNDEVDSGDGSGHTSPFLSKWQNISLLDAAVGANKKTIYHDIDSEYGRPILLKWAEYEITNAIRRHGAIITEGSISMENMFKKMHSLKFNTLLNYEEDFDNLYFRNPKNRNYYKIKHISIKDGIATRTLVRVNKSGVTLDDSREILQTNPNVISTIYDLDQLFGGAWTCELNSETRDLQYSEQQLDLVNNIICENNLKDYLIGWLVNKSAIKVGATNINDFSAWIDNSDLQYFNMSTKFGGVQMDADHELDEAEVTEASQMISALEQNGYTHNIVEGTYRELGEYCVKSIEELQEAVNNNNREKLYQIFGKAVIQAFQSGNKDTLGLAQSFIKLAQESLTENKITYNIPFSSSSINGIFNSTVTTSIIKKAIRRHYNGVPAVLNPSYGITGYYELDGGKYKYEELLDKVYQYINTTYKEVPTVITALSGYSVNDFMSVNRYMENGAFNPFIQEITSITPIDFEDTIIIYNDDDSINKVVKIDSYEKYMYFRDYDSISYGNTLSGKPRVMRHVLRPKNLKGANTTFRIGDNLHSLYDLESAHIMYFLNNIKGTTQNNMQKSLHEFLAKKLEGTIDPKEIEEFSKGKFEQIWNTIWNIVDPENKLGSKKQIVTKAILSKVRKALIDSQQKFLNDITDGKPIIWDNDKEKVIVQDVRVIPAQIAMGRLYAKQLGLHPGDSIAEIKKQGPDFFKKRLAGYYIDNNADSNSYDLVLYDGSGKKLYVKYRPKDNALLNLELYINDDYRSIDGSIYFEGKELFSSNGKEFYKYKDSNDNEFDIVVIDNNDRLREILNSHIYNFIDYNYNESNLDNLLSIEFPDNPDQIPIYSEGINTPQYYRNRSEFESTQSVINALNIYHTVTLENKLSVLAKNKYESFLKSLRFIGTRIPCQSMQSFAPMEVVYFIEADTNQIYVPTMITWLEGSDYDIDKQYVMGYSVLDNGIVPLKSNMAPYLKEAALKNRVVDNIFKVILSPKNQINLLSPISTDRMASLAKKSSMGKAAKYMNGYDPSSKYRMQIENMTGKTCIGNVATSIKSFFALSYVFNDRFDKVYNSIKTGDFDTARDLLDRYTIKYKQRTITLANVNVDNLKSLDLSILPENITSTIQSIIAFESNLADASMILGELLNISTDNAKELILKKINADSNWIDLYCVRIILGEDLETIGSFMMDSDIVRVCDEYSSSIFSENKNYDKLEYILGVIMSETNPEKKAKYQELYDYADAAEEMRFLGKILKINQGIPTNTTDLYSYVKSIEKYIERRLNNEGYSEYLKAKVVSDSLTKEWFNEEYIKSHSDGASQIIKDAIKRGDPWYKIRNIGSIYLLEPSKAKAARKLKNKLLEKLQSNWERFDLIKFVTDPEYQIEYVSKYQKSKVNFNILEVLTSVPHFREMFKALALNKNILNTLSVRNKLEDAIIDEQSKKSIKPLTARNIKDTKNKVTNFLINSWIFSKHISFNIPTENANKVSKVFIETPLDIDNFRKYIEDFVIPKLKEYLPDNKFINSLTFGLKNGIPFYKLPFNMIQIDNTPHTRHMYEECLYDFNKLKNIVIPEINESVSMNLIDIYYLYNLIVNQDKFGPNSLTRIFEDLIATAEGSSLLVYDFNNWLDNQNVEELKERYIKQETSETKEGINEEEELEQKSEEDNTEEPESVTLGFIENSESPFKDEGVQEENRQLNLFSSDNPNKITNSKFTTTIYNTKPSVQAELIAKIKSGDIKGVHVITDSKLIENDPLTPGFIKNGEVYINVDHIENDTIIHEFAHLYIAKVKTDPKLSDRYYELVSYIYDTKEYKEMRKLLSYTNKQGSDLAEELLATWIGTYYKNSESLNVESTQFVTDFLDLVPEEFIRFLKEDILPNIDVFSFNYATQQKIATVKNELTKDHKLNSDCQ